MALPNRSRSSTIRAFYQPNLRAPLRMNRRNFLIHSTAAAVTASLTSKSVIATAAPEESRVAVLVVDTDRASVSINKRIYGDCLIVGWS